MSDSEITQVTDQPQPDVTPVEGCILHISNFEGPLDLLWNLIKKAKMDIMDVSISEITEQYIAFIKTMEKMNVSVAIDFIIMASELLYYKSKALLPTGEIEDEFFVPPLPPELVQKLIEYKRFQMTSIKMKDLYDEMDGCMTRPEVVTDITGQGEWIPMSLYDLLNAFVKALSKDEVPEERLITFDEILVSDRIIFIVDLLREHDKIDFFSLFTEESKRGEIIATFLAILELTKIQKIKIMQERNYMNIAIFRNFDPAVYTVESFNAIELTSFN